jgi:hypothetical protein
MAFLFLYSLNPILNSSNLVWEGASMTRCSPYHWKMFQQNPIWFWENIIIISFFFFFFPVQKLIRTLWEWILTLFARIEFRTSWTEWVFLDHAGFCS